MKRFWIVCMAAVMLVLTACTPIAQPEDTTAPQVTTAAPVETTAPEQETTLSEDPLVAEFRELFTFTADADVWYNYALKSYYDTPAGIDIFELVYSAPWNDLELTQAEKDFLISKELDIETSTVHKYPVEKIDEVLQKYFGITFEDAEGIGLDKMVYNPDTDSYYHLHGDLETAYPIITKVEENSDGTIIVYYTESMVGDTCGVTLKESESGQYQILSNKKYSGIVFADP